MTTKLHIYEPLYHSQAGFCAIGGEKLEERFLTHIDRINPDEGYVLENCQLICIPCDQRKEGNTPDSPFPLIRTVFENYRLWQRTRSRLNLTMIASAKTPYSSDVSLGEMELLFSRAHELEKDFKRLLGREVKKIPMGEKLLAVPGTGPVTAGMLLARVDPAKAEYASSLWKFFGYAGPSKDRYKEGVKGGGSREDRAILRQWAESQVRLRTSYRRLYDKRREKTDGEDKWKSDAHRYADACRIMTKIFLAHFWEVYRKLVGLSTPDHYAMQHMSHNGYIAPEEMGW